MNFYSLGIICIYICVYTPKNVVSIDHDHDYQSDSNAVFVQIEDQIKSTRKIDCPLKKLNKKSSILLNKKRNTHNDFSCREKHYDNVYLEYKKRLDELEHKLKSLTKKSYLYNPKFKKYKRKTTTNKENKPMSDSDNLEDEKRQLENVKNFNEELSRKLQFDVNKKRQEKEPHRFIAMTSLYDTFKKRLIKAHNGSTMKIEVSNHKDIPRSISEDIYRSQNPDKITNSIRDKFYEEYRRQPKGNIELYGRDNILSNIKETEKTLWPIVNEFVYSRGHNAKRCYNNISQQPNFKDIKHISTIEKKSIFSNPLMLHDDSNYPTVLTKALESSLNPYANLSPKGLLTTVAQKMNTTPLELAQKLTNMPIPDPVLIKADNKLSDMIHKYIESAVLLNGSGGQKPTKVTNPTNSNELKSTISNDVLQPLIGMLHQNDQKVQLSNPLATSSLSSTDLEIRNDEEKATKDKCDDNSEKYLKRISDEVCTDDVNNKNEACDISEVLEKVLNKLESLQKNKETDKDEAAVKLHPEGAPCDVVGLWNSMALGLRFEIVVNRENPRQPATAEKENKILNIEALEIIPTKHHNFIDTNWLFMGSAVKQFGGPFYIYSRNPQSREIATFTGLCRTCGGVDTIFGSWTFLYPSKDCRDILTSIITKNDVMRNYKMEAKRKEKFKDFLYNKIKRGKK